MDRKNRQHVNRLQTYGKSRAVRWHRYNYQDAANVHLTICADQGEPFSDSVVAQMVCDSVVKSSALLRYQLFGFCLMPDHLHVLISPADSGIPVSHWLNSFKSFTTHEFRRLDGSWTLWQPSAHDHVCREVETAETVMRYIANNPVRQKLVENWRDWPWTKVFIEI